MKQNRKEIKSFVFSATFNLFEVIWAFRKQLKFFFHQTSLFDNVPSVEYKRLEEEKTEEQNDSLEDLTVSLNEKQNNISVTNDENENLVATENLFKYIDEDPFTLISGMPSLDPSRRNVRMSPRTER